MWTLIREVSKTCHELAKCSCKSNVPLDASEGSLDESAPNFVTEMDSVVNQ